MMMRRDREAWRDEVVPVKSFPALNCTHCLNVLSTPHSLVFIPHTPNTSHLSPLTSVNIQTLRKYNIIAFTFAYRNSRKEKIRDKTS